MVYNRSEQQEITENETQLVQFKLGDEFFGVKVEQVREIVKFGDVTHVPKMPAFIEGVMNLRGQITTIIDLRRRFGITGNGGYTAQTRIIVAEIGMSQIGIVVDSVQDVIRISSDIISPPPEVMTSKVDVQFLTGICRLKDGLLMLIDLSNLLSEEDMELLEKMDNTDNINKIDKKNKTKKKDEHENTKHKKQDEEQDGKQDGEQNELPIEKQNEV
jgi:purine-binding chemotaxis protein CheW